MSKESGFSENLKLDLPAAVVVFLVAIPLCLGIALASGAPLLSGVIAGIVGGIVVGSLSGSPLGVSGPAAGLAVIVLSAIQDLGSFDVFLVAVILAGMIQLALGFAQAGVIGYYFPSSVIRGMLTGIGIVIILKQIPHALGYDRDPEGDMAFLQIDGENSISELSTAFGSITPGAAIIALVSLTILILWETRLVKERPGLAKLPGPLVAVLVGALLAFGFSSTSGLALSAEHLVQLPLVDGIAGFSSLLTFPDLSALQMPLVYKTAFVLAVVASLETLLSVEAADKLDPWKRVTPTDRELKAQGVGNIVSGLLGGLPVTQVIVRSSANVQAGGVTKTSTIAHGILLLISVVLLPTVLNRIPLATLAAVLLVVGYKLAKPSLFLQMWGKGLGQFVPFAVTVIGVVFVDLLVGIGLGLAVAVIGLLEENFRLPFQIFSLPEEEGESVRVVLAQQVTFLNKASVLQTLATIPKGATVEIDGTESVYVHADVIEIIDDFVISAQKRQIEVVVKGLEHHQKGYPGAGAELTVTAHAAKRS